jgi:hypothetical protein
MSKSIEIEYIWNRENLDKLFESSYRYLFNNSAKRYIGWFFIALLQYGVVLALKRDAFAILLFSTILLFYWYYGKKWIAKNRAIKAFENSEFRDKTIKIYVDSDGFTISNQKYLWSDIDEVIDLGEDILIYKNPNFYYIPSSGFKSMEDKSRFKKLAKKRGVLR